MSNPRFAEYATSGVFTLTLSRNQISALALAGQGGISHLAGGDPPLVRKGLIEPVLAPTKMEPERFEFRATYAGLLCLNLVREAGLTNGPEDAVAAELAMLRRELEELRVRVLDREARAWSAMARKERVEADLADLEALRQENRSLRESIGLGLRVKDKASVTLRDQFPHLSDAELMADIPVGVE